MKIQFKFLFLFSQIKSHKTIKRVMRGLNAFFLSLIFQATILSQIGQIHTY